MMLGCPTFFNDVALPGSLWTEIWVRVFPPPDLITLPVTPEDNVKVPITIDIVHRSTGFDGEEVSINDKAVPAGRGSPVPNDSRRDFAKAHHEIVRSILVQVSYQGARLLS